MTTRSTTSSNSTSTQFSNILKPMEAAGFSEDDGGFADRHGGLRRGDQLVSVNGQSLEDMDHEDAVKVRKDAQGTLKMVVKYSPRVLEQMESNIEHTKSLKRDHGASRRH